jgi:hypothetical protein
MLAAARLLVDRERALVDRPRRREVALGLKQEGEVVEARVAPSVTPRRLPNSKLTKMFAMRTALAPDCRQRPRQNTTGPPTPYGFALSQPG